MSEPFLIGFTFAVKRYKTGVIELTSNGMIAMRSADSDRWSLHHPAPAPVGAVFDRFANENERSVLDEAAAVVPEPVWQQGPKYLETTEFASEVTVWRRDPDAPPLPNLRPRRARGTAR